MNILESRRAARASADKAERVAYAKSEEKKINLLAQPRKLDIMAADYVQTLSPSDRAPKYNKFARRSAAVDANIPTDHPMSGFAQNLSSTFRAALESPETKGMRAYDILNRLGSTMYAGRDAEGKSMADSTNRYYREDNSWNMSSLKKPMGYDNWHQELQRRESADDDKNSWLASPGEILGMGAAAAVGATLLAAAPFSGGSSLIGLPALASAFGLGAAGAIPGHAATKLLKRSETYRANESSDSTADKWQNAGLELAAYSLGEVGTFKGAGKVYKMAKAWQVAKSMHKVNISEILKGADAAKNGLWLDLTATPAEGPLKITPHGVVVLRHDAAKLTGKFTGKQVDLERSLTNAFIEDFEASAVGGVDAVAAAERTVLGSDLARAENVSKSISELGAEGLAGPTQDSAYNAISKVAEGKVIKTTGSRKVGELRQQANKGAKAYLQLESDVLQGRAITDPQGPIQGSLNALRDQKISKVAFQPKKLSQILRRPEKATKALKSINIGKLNEIAHTAGGDIRFQDMAADTAVDLENKVTRYIADKGLVAPEKSSTLKPVFKALGKWGVPAGAALLFMGDTEEANASVLGTVGKMGSLAIKALEKHLIESGITAAVLPKGEVAFAEKYIQKGVSTLGHLAEDGTKVASASETFVANMRSMTKRSTGKGLEVLHKVMSPHELIELTMGSKYKKMMSPAVQKLSYYMAELSNIRTGKQIFKNITDRVGHTSEYTLLSKSFSKLDKLAAEEMKHNFHRAEVGHLSKELTKMEERVAKLGVDADDAMVADIATWKSKITEAKGFQKEAEAGAKEYRVKYDALAKELAPNSQSLRVSLALDSHADFKKYPWLKQLLTEDDKILVGHTREFLNSYKSRMEKLGLPVIKEGYFPHRPNPMIEKMMRNIDSGRYDAQAFNRFYSRTSPVSRPAVPDFVDTINWYVGDAEKRLSNHQFWNVEGWKDVMNSKMVQTHSGLSTAFDSLFMGSNPVEWTAANKAAGIYSNYEVYKRLFLSTGAGLKHLTKAVGTIAQMPVAHIAPSIIGAGKMTMHMVAEDKHLADKLIKMGFMEEEAHKALVKMGRSLIGTNVTRQMVVDSTMEIPHETFKRLQKAANGVQDFGSFFLNTAELFDRSLSIEASVRMANKRGMTAEQALYGIHHQILTNNFVSREFNVPFLKSPMMRALAMFQATPYKIAQRRVVAGIRAKRSIIEIAKGVKLDISGNNGKQVLKDLRNVGTYIKDAESQYSANMFVNGLVTETDFFGTPVMYNSFKEIAAAGAATYGAAVGVNSALEHHFFHLPFLDQRDYRATLGLNPIIQAAMTTWHYRKENDDSFLMTQMYQNWLGTGGAVVPISVIRSMNIMEGHSPEIYGDDNLRLLRYFLSVPAYDAYHGK